MSPLEELFEDLVERAADAAAERLNRADARVPITKAKLATRYGVKERTIKTWRGKGLPGHVVGRDVMYIPLETDEWWANQPDREGRL